MKLNKKDLIKALRPAFEAIGYHYFKDSITGAQGLFGKKVSDDLYLQAALNIHRFTTTLLQLIFALRMQHVFLIVEQTYQDGVL